MESSSERFKQAGNGPAFSSLRSRLAVPRRGSSTSVARSPEEDKTMPHKKLPRNAPCPCGSGKVYGACCWDKGFEWVEDEAGTAFRSTPMTQTVHSWRCPETAPRRHLMFNSIYLWYLEICLQHYLGKFDMYRNG